MFDVRELNIAVELWGAAFCVIGFACALLFARTGSRWRNLIMAGFAIEFVSAGGDALAGIFRGREGDLAWAMVHVGNLATFIGNFLLVGVLTTYICVRIEGSGGQPPHLWKRGVQIACGVMCALAAAGAFYSIDADNLYHRGDQYWVAMAFVVVVNLVNSALILRERNRLGSQAIACLLFYSLAPVLAALIQAFVYGPNLVIVVGVAGLVVVFLEMHFYTAEAIIRQSQELAASKAEAADGRIRVMVSQIQPHFLFNALDTVYGLVDEDPETAKEAISSFSRYLRANLDSLNRTAPVPIEAELEHVRTYLDLEHMADPDKIAYEIDAQAGDFCVPALSVQTLAENAVKHGIAKRETGGTVTVRTREQLNWYTVAVTDDGVGFDPESVLETGGGVGLSNTRARVAAMCGGTLEVNSTEGFGTTVVMGIPKRRGVSGA